MTFWDAKYRGRVTNLRMSSTFDAGSDRLRNAVAEARKIADNAFDAGVLTAAERSSLAAALNSSRPISVRTVPFGRARNWVSDVRLVL